VHSGDVHGGHYYAFIRPTPKMQWYKFDDERVTRARKKDVFEGTFGGETSRSSWNAFGKPVTSTYMQSSNAYMLLYIRDDGWFSFITEPQDENALTDVEHVCILSFLQKGRISSAL